MDAFHILMFSIGIVFFLGLNAFFVANEFASARVRETQLAPDASDSPGRARKRASALHIVKNMDSYLSGLRPTTVLESEH